MKYLLMVPLVILSFSDNADERVLLGSFERLVVENEVDSLGRSFESSLKGFGAQILNLVDSGRYFGTEISRVTGNTEICTGTPCVSADTDISQTTFSGEFGWNFGNWTPFGGLSLFTDESEGESKDNSASSLGAWLDLDRFKIKGTITYVEDPDRFGTDTWLSGGLLYRMDNEFFLGAEIGMQTEGDDNGFRFSLSLGRSF
ncbi:MAG: hypothetical protein F4Z87_05695 [Gammaproteobacteria bacterium]|nr:hypothetical protein [Gammaproteobacteria bacterium]